VIPDRDGVLPRRRSNASWLFPGVAGEPKTANMFSTQITERIQKATGVRMTVHQFRHACAAIYLKHRPGEYETVKRLLGHLNIQTTINFYCGLETTQANEAFGKIIKFDDAAWGAYRCWQRSELRQWKQRSDSSI
jgi:integrase